MLYRFAFKHVFSNAELRVGVEADTLDDAVALADERLRDLVRAVDWRPDGRIA